MTIEFEIKRNGAVRSEELDAKDIWPGFGLAKHDHEMIQSVKRSPFLWSELSESSLRLSDLLEWLTLHSDAVRPPRTGHIGGTWQAIKAGGGGEVGFNRVVTDLGLGYPLLFDLNMIPSQDEQKGDTLYYPGTILIDGKKQQLDTYVFQNGKFISTNGGSFFTPFVATMIDGRAIAINHVHRNLSRDISNIQYISSVIYENWDKAEGYLRKIVDRALLDDTQQEWKSTIQKALDRWVYPNGEIESDANYIVTKDGLVHNQSRFSWDEVYAMLKKTIYIASHPGEMPEKIGELESGSPLISKEFLMLTLALLDTDFTSGTRCNGKINPHFHWGGFQMTGLGKNRGYFSSSVGNMRLMMELISIDPSERPLPIAYTLMPAAMFLLLPHSNNPNEVKAITELLKEVVKEPKGKASKQKSIDHVDRVVSQWIASAGIGKLSPAMLSRFSSFDHPMSIIPEDPTLVVPEVFYDLPIQLLTIAAGTLKQKIIEAEQI